METESQTESKSYLIPLITALVLVTSGTLYFYLKVTYPFLFKDVSTKITSTTEIPTSSPNSTQAPTPTPSPNPKEYILPSGPQIYRMSHSKDLVGPKVQLIKFDPIDPAQNTRQTITLEVQSDAPITKSSVVIHADKGPHPISLQLTSSSDNVYTYLGYWNVKDTFYTKYSIQLLFESSDGMFDNTMNIRQ